MVPYALDAVLNLVFSDWMGGGFHALALFSMASGISAFKAQQRLAEPLGAPGVWPVEPTAL